MTGKPKNQLWTIFVITIAFPPVSFTIIWMMMVYNQARGFIEPGEDLELYDLGLHYV